MNLDLVHIVLVRPADALNVGAVARAMKNCELSRLTLVEPKTTDWVTARRVAVHAEELLAAPRVVSTLEEALCDAVWVAGTTSRLLEDRPPIDPRQVAHRAREALASGPVALVFGGEESGLSNEDLVRCHAVSSIPTTSAQPSFNLAQAVLVYAYELLMAAREASPVAVAPPELAPEGALTALERVLRELLTARGFADPDRPRHGVRDLVLPLRRAGLTAAEARLWHAALKSLARKTGSDR